MLICRGFIDNISELLHKLWRFWLLLLVFVATLSKIKTITLIASLLPCKTIWLVSIIIGNCDCKSNGNMICANICHVFMNTNTVENLRDQYLSSRFLLTTVYDPSKQCTFFYPAELQPKVLHFVLHIETDNAHPPIS